MIKHLLIILFVISQTSISALLPDDELIQALENNNLSGVQGAIKKGASVNSDTNKYNVPPLFIACSKHKNPNLFIIKFLLHNGALVNGTGKNLATALHWAITDTVAQLLLEYKANANAQDIRGNTPLHKAILNGSLSRVNVLLLGGAKHLIKNNCNKSPFNLIEDELASTQEYLTVDQKETLIKIKRVLVCTMHVNDIFIKAIDDRDIQQVYELISLGISPNDKNNSYNKSPLLLAIQTDENQSYPLVKLLLSKGANPDICDSKGNTALHKVHTKNLALLVLEYGANPNAQNSFHQTPLHIYCQAKPEENKEELVSLIFNNGAAIDVQDIHGNTPLHEAIDTDIITLLINYGADIDKQNTVGDTPLVKALKEDCLEKVILLLELKASVFIKNKAGSSALTIALKRIKSMKDLEASFDEFFSTQYKNMLSKIVHLNL
ncbi:ankyrin repeat domain-containing protein [Candidatus Dependentiae bacterium]|nr:ankyrin repeat domain-containing protein [Candidatus Dependentiae bacterium]